MSFRFVLNDNIRIKSFLCADENVGTCGNWNPIGLENDLVCEKDFIRTEDNFSNEPFKIGFSTDVEGSEAQWGLSHFSLRTLTSLCHLIKIFL